MSTSQSAAPGAAAPWRSTFLEHVMSKMDSPEFVLSTLHPAPRHSSWPYIPHARYCIFRGMWAELPENKHNEAPKNDRAFETDMPTLTTDVRMNKVPEIFGTGEGRLALSGSGGGAPVEAVWWVKEVMTQWRIKGEAFVVGPDIEGEEEEQEDVRHTKEEVGKRMRVVDEQAAKNWSWQTELTGHFGNMSPGMRAMFKQPPPGRPVDQPYNDKEEEMGGTIEDLHEPVARKHFRVVIIRPEEVERLDLSNPGQAWRRTYTYDSSSGSWNSELLWP